MGFKEHTLDYILLQLWEFTSYLLLIPFGKLKDVSFNYNKWQNNQAFSKHITCHYNSNKFIGCGECLVRILKVKWA
jgi:hypothetical protein